MHAEGVGSLGLENWRVSSRWLILTRKASRRLAEIFMSEIFIDTIRNLTYSSREFSEWPVRRVKAFR
jgi:exonuclease III